MKLETIAQKIGATLQGDGTIDIARVANLVTAQSNELSFLTDAAYKEVLSKTKASAVIVKPADAQGLSCAALIMDDPYVGFAKAAQLLDTTPPVAKPGIHESAVIEQGAKIGQGVAIGPHVYVGDNAVIEEGVQLGAGVSIGSNSVIGAYTKLYPKVAVYHDVFMGSHCLVQSGAVIGSDGFGYANEKGTWIKIPQTGHVKIGSHVEIGANTCIDRGAIDDTVIEDNVIIDNLCQIAHNVKIGCGTAIAGAAVIAGSVSIGRYCIIGGTAVINGHISICDQVTLTGNTVVMRSIEQKGIYSSGIPALPNKEWRLVTARHLHLNDMYNKLKDLQAQLKKLKAES